MATKLARWVNLTDHAITFERGVSGVPWPGCDSQPGGIVEAPENYDRVCREAGYTLVTPELQTQLDEDAQLKAMLAEDAAKVAPKAVEPEPVAVEAAPQEPAATSEPARVKRRGRSD